MKIFVVVVIIALIGACAARPLMVGIDDPAEFGAPSNLCSYFAADSDMNNAGIEPAIRTYCTNYFSKSPDAVHVNADGEPYKMCLAAGLATYGNIKPITGQNIVARDFFNNTSDQVVSHSFALSGAFTQSIEIATSNTVSLSETVEYGVEIPDVLSTKFSVSTSFSSSRTQTNSASSTITYQPSTTTDCQPKCAYTAVESVNTAIYKSDMTVPLCLSGYARCQFGSRVQGHYYWYFLIDDFVSPSQRCFSQKGSLGSVISDIDSKTTMSKECY